MRPPLFRATLTALLLAGASLAAAAVPAFLEADPVRTSGAGVRPLEGRVSEPNGSPVGSALVSFRSDDGRVRATRTGRDGEFRLVRPEGLGGGGLLRVERMGYAAAERRVESGETRVELVLSPAPLPLPGFQVLVEGPTCPSVDDPGGRSLWEAMARRHPGGLDTLGVASYTLARTDTLENGNSAAGGAGDGALIPGQRGSAPLLRLSWSRRVAREGYAFPVRRSDASGSFESWSYAPLEADFAIHFASPDFGRLSRFQAVPRGAEGWSLRFCSRNERHPGIEGRLEISPDTLLVRAEWRFRTADPDEGAGGWARFPSGMAPSPPPLLPLESVIWRRIRTGGVQRRAQWYEEWILAPGDSVPFLPARKGPVGPVR
jgi:hypothetical protein